jgi:hypothetical protein
LRYPVSFPRCREDPPWRSPVIGDGPTLAVTRFRRIRPHASPIKGKLDPPRQREITAKRGRVPVELLDHPPNLGDDLLRPFDR